MADAGHMLLDATALGLAWYAARLSGRSDNHQLSYGYHRFQVLAAFVNLLSPTSPPCVSLPGSCEAQQRTASATNEFRCMLFDS